MATERKATEQRSANRDPITGEPGAHPVGVGVGTALGGAAAGAAAGMFAGPIGAAVGAVAGGVGGGLAGKAAAEEIDPTIEEGYWRQNYPTRPYYSKDVGYDAYAPAYRHGWESRSRHAGRTFAEVEPKLRDEWEQSKHSGRMAWDKAKHATQDAWNRVEARACSATSKSSTPTTVVAVFNNRSQADGAIDELKIAGFGSDQIGVVIRDAQGKTTTSTAGKTESHASDGAVAGAVAGAGIGGLVGLGILAGVIPVIGPAIVAGTLGTILSNAAGGAAIAGLTGALVGWGVPEEHAKYYEDELKAGRVVVTVHANDRAAEARTIVRRNGGYDHDSRQNSGRV